MRPLPAGKKPGLDRVLGRRDLVLLFVVAVANLNLIPAISSSGPVTLWLWLFAICGFFWPQGAAVTELAQKWPGEGGIYLWAKRSFGEQHGFMAGWCYWLSNVVYLPTVVLSCVGVAVYVAGPSIQKLAESHVFTGTASFLIILFLLALNVRGLSLGKWINNLGALGTIGGAAMICFLAALTLSHKGSALHVSDLNVNFRDWRLLAAFGTICYSLVGLDLASIMGDEIRDPRRNLPISILLGGLIAGFIYFGTTLSMLIAMPQKEIGVLSGVLQAISVMGTHTGLTGVVAPLALLECIAILGTASAWFSGAARLPFVAGVDRYLPPAVGRIHPRYHTPYVSLILFAVLSTLLIATSFMGVSVGEAYLTMLDLAVILQLAPSAYMFLALLKHTWMRNAALNANKAYLTANAVAGLLSTLIGLVVAFIPSRQVNSIWIFEAKLIAACLIVLGAALFFYRRALYKARTSTVDNELPPGIEYGS
ncbi:MAG: APC family permease [Acidobacteriaceae bacterium]